MAEGKGFAVIAKINLPPEQDYHSGHSLIVQGDTASDVEKAFDELIGGEGTGKVVLARFAEFALKGGVEETLKPSAPAASAEAAPAGETGEVASKALLKLVAKKTGKSVEELGALTKAQAQALTK